MTNYKVSECVLVATIYFVSVWWGVCTVEAVPTMPGKGPTASSPPPDMFSESSK